jgi:geranylgeranyl reductase family protein
MPAVPDRFDVVVVGGGPSGAAAAYWLAEAGHHVVVLEKSVFPRDKTCGDGLTPRAVGQLHDMGLAGPLSEFHRFGGLRSVAHGMTLELEWPRHPEFPPYGYVVPRRHLDEMVAEAAVKAGATLWQATEAIAPLVEGGLVVGALAKRKEAPEIPGARGVPEIEVRGRYLLVADGANSRFGRALGTARARRYPLGMAIRGYFRSPGHDQDWIESHLDLRDRKGDALPGYGWIFPVGDGTVNVGVGLLSTFRDWKGVNTSHLMEAFVEMAPSHWELSPDTATCAPTGGRLPMGNSVEPSAGPTWLVAGDAAGSINPFNGEGIAYAYETGRIAAEVLDQALRTGDGLALARYPARLEDAYGLYFRVARAFVRAIGNPLVMRELTRVGMRSRSLMEWVLRIMSNMLRPDEVGPAEAAYRLVERLVALGPEP